MGFTHWAIHRHSRQRKTRYYFALAFSPDGQTLASGGERLDGRVNGKKIDIQKKGMVDLWNVQNGQLTRTFTGYSGIVTSVAFSPDGRILAAGSMDKTIKVWRVR